MLPQFNSDFKYAYLQENAIYVKVEGNNNFYDKDLVNLFALVQQWFDKNLD